tara:strand:+ start:398 stop:640 length:243 start_codon:yes stop_codon:yes gene_type:complete
MVQRKEIRVMNIKEMNPVVNAGTNKNPLMVLCATTMMMMFEESTGKKFSENMDDYLTYIDGYRDGYNAIVEGTQLTKWED